MWLAFNKGCWVEYGGYEPIGLAANKRFLVDLFLESLNLNL